MSTDHNLTDTEHARIKSSLDFGTFSTEPAIVLSCIFRPQPNSVENIFSSSSKVVELIESPPRFRSMGWDLQTLDRARPVAGEYLEVANGKRKLLRIYRDGQHTFAAGKHFFGHGVNQEDSNSNLNLLSIAECIANFAVFSKRLLPELQNQSNTMIVTVTVSNPAKQALKVRAYDGLSTDEVGSLELEWAERSIVIINPDSISDMKIAYQVYAELCYFFGMRSDQIWYVDKEKQEINIADFTRLG